MKIKLLSAIFVRIENPVKAFDFQFIQNHPLPAAAEKIRNGSRQKANLANNSAYSQANLV